MLKLKAMWWLWNTK